MAVTDDIKGLLSIKIKPRQDSYTDQFLRILMVKIMLMGALLVGLNWYSDKITCIIPGALGVDGGFVSSACWINGLYVYEAIRYHANEVGYYGIPRDVNIDGMLADGKTLCSTTDRAHSRNSDCIPMEKTFFLQYQYMTFFMLAMAALYYSPYAIFRKNNEDMNSLKGSITDASAEAIVKNYFNDNVNSKTKMRIRILGDIVVKILYVIVSIVALVVTDGVLNGRFLSYGISWTDWSKLSNAMAYDYMGRREFPKPGNALLPSFGFCEVHEAAQDIKHVVTNTHKFVCEISQHILYQYAFIIIWFAMVFAIVVAVIGLLALLVDYFMTATCFLKGGGEQARRMYGQLTLRECHYLEFIRKKNLVLYGDVIARLKSDRHSRAEDNGGIPLKEGYKA